MTLNTAVISNRWNSSSAEEGILRQMRAKSKIVTIPALIRDLLHLIVLISYVAQYLIFLKDDEILSLSRFLATL